MTRESLTWEPYDPTWLVRLAVTSEPELTWLHEELARCTVASRWTCCAPQECGWSFLDRDGRGGGRRFVENIILEDPHSRRSVVLDILEGNRVGGVEFL